ncbi:DNA sulfur modification protein DndE [Halogranum amylolyticum]|uniref:DNA sulfur modification protein DndE n=1 Tax=Halogranum amylolyticum TaxID=660520 RepID=A0A1H8W5R0_9EURY|nr:DNA sulfur modification protein DndE [Halogranum amylolyticum]SEP22982.1 DNA sulfur modification protein DndE [Halogranum amylolyticum]
MSESNFNRIQIDSDVTHRLKMLKGATGLTPNYLARIGLCFSLNEPRPPNPEEYDNDGQVFNRFTLLGEHDALYMALLRERLLQEGYEDPNEVLYDQFLAHLNRGVETLQGRVTDLSDLHGMIPAELKAEQ